jgi:uncharacterized protein (DUF305 family)
MKSMKRFWIFLVLIPVVTLAAWRQESYSHTQMNTGETPWTELMVSMEKMDAAMASVKPSGDGDVDFVRLMLPHHQAAIEMAKSQLLYGKDPQMRRLAQEIITEQESEIQLMQLWLKRHEPVSSKADQPPLSSVGGQ